MVVSLIPCTLSLSSLGGGMANGMPKRVSGSDGGCDAYLAILAEAEDRIEGVAAWIQRRSRPWPDPGIPPFGPLLGSILDPIWSDGEQLVVVLAHATPRVSPLWASNAMRHPPKGPLRRIRGPQMGSQMGSPDGVSWG